MKKFANRLLMALGILAVAVCAGCSKKTAPAANNTPAAVVETPSGENVVVTEPVEEDVTNTEIKGNTQTEAEDAKLVIEMTWDAAQGVGLTPNLQYSIPYTETENTAVSYKAVDENENALFEFRNGNDGDITIESADYIYTFYTLDYNFDMLIEPNGPENSDAIQSVVVTVTYQGETKTYTFEDLGTRGGTGIWYVNVGSVMDGVFTSGAEQFAAEAE